MCLVQDHDFPVRFWLTSFSVWLLPIKTLIWHHCFQRNCIPLWPRWHFVPSVFQDQYKFCYEVALEYLNAGWRRTQPCTQTFHPAKPGRAMVFVPMRWRLLDMLILLCLIGSFEEPKKVFIKLLALPDSQYCCCLTENYPQHPVVQPCPPRHQLRRAAWTAGKLKSTIIFLWRNLYLWGIILWPVNLCYCYNWVYIFVLWRMLPGIMIIYYFS